MTHHASSIRQSGDFFDTRWSPLVLVIILFGVSLLTGCGDGGNRVISGDATEYQLRAEAQAQYEEAMRKASEASPK
jgi:hypothetical protein